MRRPTNLAVIIARMIRTICAQAVSDAGQGPGRSCAIAVGQDFDSFAKNTSSVQTLGEVASGLWGLGFSLGIALKDTARLSIRVKFCGEAQF